MPRLVKNNGEEKSLDISIEQKLNLLIEKISNAASKNAVGILPYQKKLEAISKEHHLKNYLGLSKLFYAYYICSAKNNYSESLRICIEGFEMMEGKFKAYYKPYFHLNCGRAYQFMGEHVNAQSEYLQAIQILEFNLNKTFYETRWLGSCYYNIFILFNQEGLEFTQQEYLQKAFDIYKSLNDLSGLANCSNSFAVFHYKKNEFEESLKHLTRAYDLAKEAKNVTVQSIFASNCGLIYAKTGNKKQSLYFFNEAKKINAIIKSSYHRGHTFQQLGEAWDVMGDTTLSIKNFILSEKVFLKLGVKSSLAIVYNHLSQVYAKVKMFDLAFEYQKKYALTIKEQFNDDKTFAITKARNQFEIEKKQKETELLLKKNKEIEDYANKLEISNNQLRQFAHIASHDLKEPIRMVSSYAQLLSRSLGTNLTTDQIEYLHFIMTGTSTMKNLVNDLLLLSNINYISDKQPVHLTKLLKIVLTNLDPIIQEKNAKIFIGKLPKIKAEETQILQLFQNLISNALKYNIQKHPTIEIKHKLKKGMHEFIISDNGIGIPEEYRDKVFDIFQRLHTRTEYSGTGIGLTICKKIIDQLNGSIWIESNKLGGTDFKFTIPT